MASLFNVPNKTMLHGLANHAPGEVAFCEEEQKYMIYKDEEWQELELSQTPQDVTMTAYEINRQIYENMPAMEDFTEISKQIDELVTKSDCWLLFCKEIGYFSLFNKKENCGESFSEVFIDCLKYISKEVKEIEILDNGSVEIWFTTQNDITTVMYLFDFKEGLVYYE